MKRFIITTAAVAFTIAIFSTAGILAQQPDPTKKKVTIDPNKKGLAPNNTKGRALYHARDFRGWTSYCWLARYRCYGYYSSMDRTWFYYCNSVGRFLPLSYITQYPPTPVTPTAPIPPGGAVPPGGPALPPGGSALPPGGAPAPLPGDPVPTPQ